MQRLQEGGVLQQGLSAFSLEGPQIGVQEAGGGSGVMGKAFQSASTDGRRVVQASCSGRLPHLLLSAPLESIRDFVPGMLRQVCSSCIDVQIEHEVDLEASVASDDESLLCAFCRADLPKNQGEEMDRLKRRMQANDANAFYFLAGYYSDGKCGLQQNQEKAMELYFQAADRGCVEAQYLIGKNYLNQVDFDLELNKQRAEKYFEIAAMGGHDIARNTLGGFALEKSQLEKALAHWFIGARVGVDLSLENIRRAFMRGMVAKETYEVALRAHHNATEEMKSDQREKFKAENKRGEDEDGGERLYFRSLLTAVNENGRH
ncbi:hypothetical protein ACHAXT_010615 [Thalassiosira profunda]